MHGIRRRRRFRRGRSRASAGAALLAALVGLAGIVAPGPARADSSLVDLDPDRLPWHADPVSADPVHLILDRGWTQSVLVVRGHDEDIVYTARNPGIVKTRVTPTAKIDAWQHNLDPIYCGRTPCAGLEGLWDVDGDGRNELVLCTVSVDRSRWLIQALDTDSGKPVAEITLAAGPDRRGEDGWDGHYSVVGVADVLTDAGPRPAYLVVAEAGFDLEPRGVLAVDTRTGRTLWSFLSGAKPVAGQTAGADLDGDGRTDVVYIGAAVHNLGGRKVNGISDDACSIVAVGSDGDPLWVRAFPDNVSGFLKVGDAEGNGGADIVAVLSGRSPEGATLLLLDGGTGRTIASRALGGSPLGLGLTPGSEVRNIYTGVVGLGIIRIHWDGHRLRETALASSHSQPSVDLVADVLPPAGPEVFATDQGGRLYVLDAKLRPLAYLPQPGQKPRPGGVIPWPEAGPVPWVLIEGNANNPGQRIAFHRVHRSLPWGALALLPVAGGAVWYLRRRRRGASPATQRELRLQLLARLELSSHGAIGALRSLRRLVWLLDARAQAGGGAPDLDARLQNLAAECREHMLPDLAGIVELAELAGCDDALTAQARGAHQRLADLLEEIGLGTDHDRDQDLQRAGTLLETTLKTLRGGLEADFAADLADVVRRVLAAHADAVAAADVAVVTEGLDAPLWCRVDGEELVFVVDNLVENALRAMAASVQRELTLTARRTGSRVQLQVQDTGCGIAPDDWDAVLETRLSSREGGGLGLPESLRLLRKYGGSLAVTASQAGTGTTLTMSVAPARARDDE